MKLHGKVAIVTGASKGIGAAIAKGMAKAGANVVVKYASDRSGAEKAVAAITAAGGKAVAVKADVSKLRHLLRAMASKRHGPTRKARGSAGRNLRKVRF